MMRVYLILILFVFQLSAQKADIIRDARIQLCRTWLQENLDYYHIPGIVVAVTQGDQIIWSQGFGTRSLETSEKMTDQTIFRIASISKVFTSTAIMQLRDKGLLKLDDAVQKYLPWFKIQNPFPDTPGITIRHLLTHTSGLPRESEFPYWTDRKFPSREQLISKLPHQKMIYPPETKYKYSNLGMSLLGEIITAVTSLSFPEYIKQNILKPLALRSTVVRSADINKELFATGYLRFRFGYKREAAPFTDSKALIAAANLSSSASDLARFCIFHYDRDNKEYNRILKKSTRREMQRPHWIGTDWNSARGLGFSIIKSGEYIFIGHGGWVAGYRSQILFCPDNQTAVVVLMNTEDFSPAKIARTLLKIWLDWKPSFATENVHKPKKMRLTGPYMDTSYWQTDVLELGENLYFYDYSYPPSSDPVDNLRVLVPESEYIYKLDGPNGNGEPVTFEVHADEVRQIKIGANYIFPLNQFTGQHR